MHFFGSLAPAEIAIMLLVVLAGVIAVLIVIGVIAYAFARKKKTAAVE